MNMTYWYCTGILTIKREGVTPDERWELTWKTKTDIPKEFFPIKDALKSASNFIRTLEYLNEILPGKKTRNVSVKNQVIITEEDYHLSLDLANRIS